MTKLNLFILSIFLLLITSCKENSTQPTDSEKPTIVILYPANGAEVKADTSYKIIADATDNKGITKVEFYVDGQNAATDNSSPYEYIWNTTGLSGDHTIFGKGYDEAGNVGSSAVINVKIKGAANHAPSVPSNPTPADSSTGQLINPTLRWSCTDVDGDSITYDVFFGTANPPTTQVTTGQGAILLSRTGLLNSTKYYWQVVAKDNRGGTTTGLVWSFTTTNPPTLPSNPNPTDGASGVSTSPTLSWSCSDPDGDALTYDVYFGTNSNPTTTIATNQSATNISRSGLSSNTTYYWKIVAKDSKGATTVGTVWSFTTTVPPAIPSNPNPTDGASGVSTSPTISWSCSDPDGDAITYDVFFGTNNPPNTQVSTGQSGKTLPRIGLSSLTTYYWKVIAKDSKGATTVGTVWSFTTVNNPPVVPSNPNPTDGASGVSTSPTLSWSCSDPDGDALTYDVYFGTNSNPTTTIATNLSTKSISGIGLNVITTYYWRIDAKDSKGATSSGTVWSFTSDVNPPGMVYVASGTFQMGSPDVANYSVTVGSFYMDKTEITYEKWTEVRNWGLTHGYTDLPIGAQGYLGTGANQPVTTINWYDIVKWCNARSEMDGFEPTYYTSNTLAIVYRTDQIDLLTADRVKWKASGYRLPTEAEWEFAARGGTESNSYTYSGSDTLDNVAWYNLNSGFVSHPVAGKAANELGLYDMSGNVYEWCWDLYGEYASGSQTDPKGAVSGASRVYRGGSLYHQDVICRVIFRGNNNPANRYEIYGFRCVKD